MTPATPHAEHTDQEQLLHDLAEAAAAARSLQQQTQQAYRRRDDLALAAYAAGVRPGLIAQTAQIAGARFREIRAVRAAETAADSGCTPTE